MFLTEFNVITDGRTQMLEQVNFIKSLYKKGHSYEEKKCIFIKCRTFKGQTYINIVFKK